VMRTRTRYEWMGEARCLAEDPARFFPNGRPSNESRSLCDDCPAREARLERALSSPWEPSGVWGGVTERDLVPVWRERHAAVHHEIQRMFGLASPERTK